MVMQTINEIQDEVIEEFEGFDDWMDKYQMLIDLGNELAPLDERYKTELPLIITTNKTWDEIKNPKNVGDARIFSRIREMCVPVFVGGDDKRESKAEAKLRRLKEIIE